MKHSEPPDWDYDETQSRILNIPNPHIREFAITSYVTGGRLNEVRMMRGTDMVEAINDAGEQRIKFRVPTLKNPHVDARIVPFNPLTEAHYYRYLRTVFVSDASYYPFQQFSERHYRRKIRKFLGTHVHALRHLRVHHCDDQAIPGMKGLTPRQFKDLFGWALISTSTHYQSRTRSRDMINLF